MKLSSIILSVFCLSIIGMNDAQHILLYTLRDFQGQKFEVSDISRCSNLQGKAVANTLSVDTRGNCVRLYKGWNCSGAFVEILPRSPSHYSLGAWKFNDWTRSVGPCRDECDKDVTGYDAWELPPPQEIRVFNKRNYDGMSKTINVKGCTQIPQEFVHNLMSVKIGDASCVQLYDNRNCLLDWDWVTGMKIDTIELRKGTPSHNNISNWDFPTAWAVSQCNFKCYKKYLKETAPELGEVVLFNQSNFTGNWVKLKLEKCMNLTGPWEGSVISIKMPSKTCIVLHEGTGCTGDFAFLSNSSPNLAKEHFEKKAKSLQPCHTDKIDEDKDIPILSGTNATETGTKNQTLDATITFTNANETSVAGTEFPSDIYPENGELIFFNKKNYKGNWLKIKLLSCQDLFELWDNITLSVKVYKKNCFIFYDQEGCTGEPNYVVNSFPDLSEETFGISTKSLLPCRMQRAASIPVSSNETEDTKSISETESELSSSVIGTMIAIPLLVLIFAAIVLIYVIRRYRPYKKLLDTISEKELQEFINGLGLELTDETEASPWNYSADLMAKNKPYDNSYDVPRSKVQFDERVPLGSGEFGVVFKGILNTTKNVTVAVKTLRSDARVQSLRNLLKEVKIMMYVGQHENIVQLVGCCTESLRTKGEVLVLVEYCAHGSLELYLRNHREIFQNFVVEGEINFKELARKSTTERTKLLERKNFDTLQLLKWCHEVAIGMEFLASKHVIHSDLATRNVLLDDNLHAKISDFGLSKQLYSYTQYVKMNQEPLPWRWMALESLKDMEFSTLSDVWGYGVLCWEIFALGEKPYQGIVWNEDFMRSLDDGLRLRKPNYAPNECYNLMTRCWEKRPDHRPTFCAIVEELGKCMEKFT